MSGAASQTCSGCGEPWAGAPRKCDACGTFIGDLVDQAVEAGVLKLPPGVERFEDTQHGVLYGETKGAT